jgi:hypothetical protein
MKIDRNNCDKSLWMLFTGIWLFCIICSCVLADDACLDMPPPMSKQQASAAAVTYSATDKETTYGISSGNCAIYWIARDAEPGVILRREKCSLPLSGQIPLLAQICTEFFNSGHAPAFRTLFWGRLAPDGSLPVSQELSIRIARAAHKSPGWDVKKGRPKNGDINGFIKDLANRQMIYPELKELFERFHKNITLCCVEKVLVAKAGNLPFFDQLKQDGIRASDRLPFDCLAWFAVAPPSF